MSLGFSFAKQIKANKSLHRWLKPLADKYVDIAGYRKVGLKYDDIIIEEVPAVQRALGRLTPEETYDRAYRLRVASNCSVLHKDLPKEEWLPAHKDKRYLTPQIEEIELEDAERAMWDGSVLRKPKAGGH